MLYKNVIKVTFKYLLSKMRISLFLLSNRVITLSCWFLYLTLYFYISPLHPFLLPVLHPPGGTFQKHSCDAIFTVCSHTFTLFWSRKASVITKIFPVSVCLCVLSSGDLLFFQWVFPFFSYLLLLKCTTVLMYIIFSRSVTKCDCPAISSGISFKRLHDSNRFLFLPRVPHFHSACNNVLNLSITSTKCNFKFSAQ